MKFFDSLRAKGATAVDDSAIAEDIGVSQTRIAARTSDPVPPPRPPGYGKDVTDGFSLFGETNLRF